MKNSSAWLIKKLLSVICTGVFFIALSGCAQKTLNAPCPGYGKWCSKTPINSWNYQQS